jgi:hypothetical protein
MAAYIVFSFDVWVRIPDKQTLTEEVAALEDSRNKKRVKADWQFTTADARVKLNRLYPAM